MTLCVCQVDLRRVDVFIVWLEELVQKDHREQYKNTIENLRRHLGCILTHELTSCKIPLDVFLNICPVMQPRLFTISSSSAAQPKSPQITSGIVQEKVGEGLNFVGLCSRFVSVRRMFISVSQYSLIFILLVIRALID